MGQIGTLGASALTTAPKTDKCYIITELEIRKLQDLAKDLGETASKAKKKICQSKIVSYIQKHNKTVIPK